MRTLYWLYKEARMKESAENQTYLSTKTAGWVRQSDPGEIRRENHLFETVYVQLDAHYNGTALSFHFSQSRR